MPNGESFEVDRVTVAMVAIAYVLQQSAVGGVILGSPDLQYVYLDSFPVTLLLGNEAKFAKNLSSFSL